MLASNMNSSTNLSIVVREGKPKVKGVHIIKIGETIGVGRGYLQAKGNAQDGKNEKISVHRYAHNWYKDGLMENLGIICKSPVENKFSPVIV